MAPIIMIFYFFPQFKSFAIEIETKVYRIIFKKKTKQKYVGMKNMK